MTLKEAERKNLHNASLLVVDDDSLVLATTCIDLRNAGFKVLEASSGEEALELCVKHKFDLALLDFKLPGQSGVTTARIILEKYNVHSLFLSAFNDEEIVGDAINYGALGYLVKPVNTKQLIPAVETALKRAADIQSLMLHQDNLNNALNQSRETSVAIGIFMSHTSLSPEQAENALRLYSRNTHQKMNCVAKSIIKASNDLNALINAINTQSVYENHKN